MESKPDRIVPCRLDKYLADGLQLSKKQINEFLKAGNVHIAIKDQPERVATVADHPLVIFPGPASQGGGDTVRVNGELVPAWDHADGRVMVLNKPKNLNVLLTKVAPPPSNIATLTRRPCFASWVHEMEQEIDRSILRSEVQQSSNLDHSATDCRTSNTGTQRTKTRLFNIGRLDKKTTGLILVTNDGDLSFLLCTPHAIEKEYVATVKGKAEEHHMKALLAGIQLTDGFAKAESASILSSKCIIAKAGSKSRKRKRSSLKEDGSKNDADSAPIPVAQEFKKYESEVRVVVRMGKNRIVRRLLAAIDLPVMELQRTRIGPLDLKSLGVQESHHIELSAQQVKELWDYAGGEETVQQGKIAALVKRIKSGSCLNIHEKDELSLRMDHWLKCNGFKDLANFTINHSLVPSDGCTIDQNQCID